MLKIGDTIYRFDVNRRKYSPPPPGSGRIWGDLIYREHFHALKIVGETRHSWVLEHNYKAKKSDLAKPHLPGRTFHTEEQMEENVWRNTHRMKIVDWIQTHATTAQLKQIAEIIGYSAHAA